MLQSIPITGAVLSLSDAHGSAQPYLGSFAPRNDPQKSILGRAPRDFCELDLRTAVFTGMLLQGAVFDDSNLSGASFRRADLYWSNFFRADLTGAFSLTESVGRLMIPAVTIDSRHESALVRYYQRDGRFPGQRIMRLRSSAR